MEVPTWLDEHWVLVYFSVDLLLVVGAVALWKPGSRPIAALLFVFALILPVAFLTVLFTNFVMETGAD